VTLGQGADQSASGTAYDVAGNSSVATVGNINIDETAPTLTGSIATQPSGTGPDGSVWYNTPVTVAWSCQDNLSGIDASQSVPASTGGNGCPGNSTVTGEGKNGSATASIADNAGNTQSATVGGIHIDTTAPSTTADAPTGWQNTSVTVALTPSDNLSGVAATYYTVDGGNAQPGTSVAIGTEGVHTLAFWSVDYAGNVEQHQTVQVKIDKTNPTITGTLDPAANAAGWNNTNVNVKFTCADPNLADGNAGSGIASCTPETPLTAEGAGQTVTGTAVDNAGNSAATTETVNIDKTPPSIIGSADRLANSNGWYNKDVNVGFTCSDALSGIAACPAAVKLSQGAGQSASGTAYDFAGNSSMATVSNINIDETAPTLTGSITTSSSGTGPDGSVWYNTPVTVAWSCQDTPSGIDGSCPGDSTITGQGLGLTTTASVNDKAGNSTASTSPSANIDTTAPSTVASAPSNWTNSDVTVHLSASDGLSHVKDTHYILDGGQDTTGTDVTITAEGVHTLEYWSVDYAGNVEPHQNVTIKIDKSAPQVNSSLNPSPNSNGWNNSTVTVTFTCSDPNLADGSPGSGLASCAGTSFPSSPVSETATGTSTVTTEGGNQGVTGTATDNAGNTASTTATVNLDKTPPTINGSADRAANANGWYNAKVIVSFTCNDTLSGVAANGCSSSTTLNDGANQSVTGNAADVAGNTASTTVDGINIDTAAPTLTGSITTQPSGTNGGTPWYNQDVTVAWSCSDALSGIDPTSSSPAAGGNGCPGNSTLKGEGAGLSAGASVSDKAGNVTNATVGNINIDRTAPQTTSDAPASWVSHDVTVHFSATDNLSGVKATYYTVDGQGQQSGSSATVSGEGLHTLKYWSVDNAGNVENGKTAVVQIDKTAPTITGAPTSTPNGNGWYNQAVTVHFTCTDPKLADGNLGSGVASCQPDVKVPGDGPNQSATGSATDNAGNTSSATVSGLKIDTTAPTVTVNGIKDNATYVLGTVPAASCTATDATSGVDSNGCKITVTGGLPNGVGSFSFTAKATDLAGNSTSVSGSYQVVYNVPSGQPFFLQPVNDTAHQIGLATSIFKAGQTVPMKFQLKNAAGQVVQANSAPIWLTPVRGSSTAAAVNESAYGTSGDSGSTYRWDGTQYIYNWQTPSTGAGYYWRVGVQLDDGRTYFVNIGLR
jgi:hypothetical protein